MRFEEASRARRDLEALATLSARASRLSRIVTENNLVIVTGSQNDRAAYVVLSGRLALVRENLDSPDVAAEIAAFVADNYERYRSKPVAREELEAMTMVARWLRERDPDDGRLIYLTGPRIDPAALPHALGQIDEPQPGEMVANETAVTR